MTWATRTYWGLLTGVLLLGAFCHVAQSWDGSYYLFHALNDQTPYIPHARYVDALLQWPVIAASHLTANMNLLQFVFALPYTLVPLLSLALCWWTLRRYDRSLFIWPALGILLIALPGQISMTNEANIAAQLSWPLFVAALVGVNRRRLAVLLIVAMVVLITHPSAILLFGVAAAVAVLVALTLRDRSAHILRLAAVYAGFCLLAIVKFAVTNTSYEDSQISISVLQQHLSGSVTGKPLAMLLLSLLVCAAVLASSWHSAAGASWQRWLTPLVLLSCILIGVVGLTWALDLRSWGEAIDYRTYIGPFSLVIVAFAVLDRLIQQRSTGSRPQETLPEREASNVRRVAVFASAGVFTAVFAAQSITWLNATGRLHDDLMQNATACLPIKALPWTAYSALGHWSVTPLSLLMQGKEPHKVVVTALSCDQTDLVRGVPIGTFARLNYQGGWFNLQPLRSGVTRIIRLPALGTP